jgi:hypothetical protein
MKSPTVFPFYINVIGGIGGFGGFVYNAYERREICRKRGIKIFSYSYTQINVGANLRSPETSGREFE